MSTIFCPFCKQAFSIGTVPSENLSYLIADTSEEGLVDRIMEISGDENLDEEQKETAIGYEIATRGNEVYVCPHCGVMIVSGKGGPAGVYRRVNE